MKDAFGRPIVPGSSLRGRLRSLLEHALGLTAPDEVGGGAWTWDTAWAYLGAHSSMSEAVRRFELERYLGWPGQAPSYKVGERLWLELRDEVRRREGDAFDLKAFHRRALDVGSVGMDVVRAAVLGEL